MPTTSSETRLGGPSKRVLDIATKLERHIQASGLKPGDRYITADQASKLMGASAMTTQRAMNVLAQRNVLERRRKAGTFIGQPSGASVRKLSCIHFLLPDFMAEKQEQENYWDQIHGQIQGLRRVIPDLSVQFNFIPNQDVGYTQEIVSRTAVSGAILVLSSRPMRAFFDHSGIPTVVEGSSEPDLANLCWVDWDQAQTGRLLADHLLQCGHRQIATIMRNVWSIGEHLLHDGINEALGAAGLGPTTIRSRSAPLERAAIGSVAHTLLNEKNPPTGFICRTEFQAECVLEVARELGMGDRIEVALCNPPRRENIGRYSCVVPLIESVQHGELIGTLLQGLVTGNPPLERGHKIPVQLRPAKASPQ